MAKPIIVITGDDELNKKLKLLAGKDAKKVVRKSLRPALKPVLQEARGAAPTKSGQLKKNIKIKSIARSRTYIGARVTSGLGKAKSGNENSGVAYYGSFLEYGTKPRTTKSGANRGKVKPIRFMLRAAEKKREHALRIYRAGIAAGLKEIALRG
jgi:HK97 gp10 family phage protein